MKIRFMFSYTYVHTFKTIDLTRWVVVWSSNEEQYRQAELNRNRNHLKNSRSLTYDVYLHNMTDGNILMISLSAQVTTAMSDVIHQMKYNREIRKDGWTWRTFTYNFVYIQTYDNFRFRKKRKPTNLFSTVDDDDDYDDSFTPLKFQLNITLWRGVRIVVSYHIHIYITKRSQLNTNTRTNWMGAINQKWLNLERNI